MAGLKFKRLPRDKSIEISQSLELQRYNSRREKLPEGQLSRDLTTPEQELIQSERILCRASPRLI